jgi:dephospho-CoA kinase
MVVQVIGLPCSGKTTAIKTFLENNQDIIHLDIRDCKNEKDFYSIVRQNMEANKKVIAESAAGINIRNTEVIKLSATRRELFKRSMSRDNSFDEDYLSLLETVMLRTKYTANNKDGLLALLNKLFKS